MPASRANPIGREPELVLLDEFLARDGGLPALVLLGGPGIGKTILWEAAIEAGRSQGMRVLATRASEAEAGLSFTALIDLFDGVERTELAPLPTPQLNALEIALLRSEPADRALEPGTIAFGVLNALRVLAERKHMLVAIDDVQWLDAPSADALVFAVRRLELESITFLLARRPGRVSALERSLQPERLDVGPLSLGAIRRLLTERLGLNVPRHLLRRIVDSTLGNPLFALELGRTLLEQGLPSISEELPVPDAVEDLVGTRVQRVPPSIRRLLLAVALSAELRAADLGRLAGASAVEEAVEAGLLILDGERVRAAHPLLAGAARKRSRPPERRALHRELADLVADQELRARHLALATDGPDDTVAATVAAAAGAASSRGARQMAVVLAEHALRLTPPQSQARVQRVLALAEYLETAGESRRLTDLLMPELSALPRGSLRARAWLLLAEGADVQTLHDYRRYLERALAESADDPVLHAYVVANTSTAVIGVERIREAEAQALDVLPAARADPEVERVVLYALAWARSLRGYAIDDLCERFEAVSGDAARMWLSPDRIAGQRLVWRGELDRAQTAFTRLLEVADERGEAGSYAFHRLHLCEQALRAGAWAESSQLLDEWAAERDFLVQPKYERCRALLAAGRGVPDEAERWAAEALARAESVGSQWERLEALRARGLAAVLAHDPVGAAESLRAVWEHTEHEGVEEPGVFPVAPDLVEALVERGDAEEACAVTDRLRELSQRLEHPWGLITTKRCDSVLRLALGYDPAAARALEQAAEHYGALGLRFDAARSMLLLGRGLRRHRKWGAARRALEHAGLAFGELGSPGWAEEARSELARVGARRPAAEGGLTPAERRVAELAGDGLANKEIAQALFVSVKTVEGHLSRVYAKLGVRSRAQLARRLSHPG